MSTFIKLNKQDAFISSYISHKRWSITETDAESYGIQVLPAISSGGTLNLSNPVTDEEKAQLLYRSIEQLYYRQPNTSTDIDDYGYQDLASYSYEKYNTTTLENQDVRTLEDHATVIQIPRNLTGIAIKPTSFILSTRDPFTGYVLQDYVDEDYVEDGQVPVGNGDLTLIDDGNGNILNNDTLDKVGDIIYSHGIIIITNEAISTDFNQGNITGYVLYFKSTKEILTHNYRCKVRETQLNATYNKTAYDSTTGELNTNVQNSYFEPYVTTVGLYNETHELIAVAKLSKPHPKSQFIDTTFVVSLDI